MMRERLILQSDWENSLSEVNGTAWITLKSSDVPTIHSQIKNDGMSQNDVPVLSCQDGFVVDCFSKKSIRVSYSRDGFTLSCQFIAPEATFSSIHRAKKAVQCLDVTSHGLGVSSDTGGGLMVWQTDNGETRRVFRGHVGDIYTCKLFPSGIVVLSAGADMQVKIWSVETGQEAANIIGHKAAILDTAIVDVGRNVVTCSRDGTARLWDVGRQAELYAWSDLGGEVNCCEIAVTDSCVHLGTADTAPHEHEVLTENKLLLLGMESGFLLGFGLLSRKPVFSLDCGAPVTCACFISSVLAVCGTKGGDIVVVDLRDASVPLFRWKESRSAIQCLLQYNDGFFVSTGDGSVFHVDGSYNTATEFTGSDCDTVYSVARDPSSLYASCRDGSIRKYSISLQCSASA